MRFATALKKKTEKSPRLLQRALGTHCSLDKLVLSEGYITES